MANVDKVRNINPTEMDLGGKRRIIQFDMNAFAEMESRYETIDAGMKKLASGKMQDVRTLLWMALIHDEVILDEVTGEPVGYKITPYQVGSWIKNPQMLEEVCNKLSIAMGQSMPSAEDLAQGNKAPQASSDTAAARGDVQIATVVLTEEEKAEQAKNA